MLRLSIRVLTLVSLIGAIAVISHAQNAVGITYVYEGDIVLTNGKHLPIKLNILFLKDSWLVGSYHYIPQNGSLKLVGKIRPDSSFNLTERDNDEEVTGHFAGKFSDDRSEVTGNWCKPDDSKCYTFRLTRVFGTSFWDVIAKNRALNEFTDLQNAVRNPAKVLSIDVANQGLSQIPTEIVKLEKIVSMNLLGNEFESFPEELMQLTTLDEISLSSNNVTTIPSSIKRLKNLKVLILNNNQIESLPKEIGDLSNLLYLEIGNNRISRLPDEISRLTALQELHIDRNRLSESEKSRLRKLLPNCVIHF